MKKYTIASFFAGVGGIDLGFERTGCCETIYANEIDKSPIKTFEMNFDIKVDHRSICDVSANEVPDVDFIVGGFPCQAFSVAGYRQGFDDEKGRGTLFFELLRIIEAKMPRVVFLENVKNLKTHDHGNTFRTIIESLEKIGYHTISEVYNAKDYGNSPQNRERIYIVCFRDEKDYQKYIPPKAIPLKNTLFNVIDFKNKVDDKYYYDGKYKPEMIEMLKLEMTNQYTVYQWRRKYVRANKSGVIPTLTANMGEGGHNVPLILSDYGIRKLTPRECFNAQGFPKKFKLPHYLPDSKLYKQAGNSVCVTVINNIAQSILNAIKED